MSLCELPCVKPMPRPRKQRPKPKPCASTTLNVLPVY
nr:MAG TPA_asm: hypothetical protein [Caudoviricetes sp.]